MIKQYLMRNALKVLKEPYGKLKYPFIDPGAGYEGNLWDWDSFFTAKALCESFSVLSEQEIRSARISKAKVTEHIKGCVLNFLDAQEEDGYVPIMLCGKGGYSEYFHVEHAKGTPMNQSKPFLCQSALQAGGFAEDYSWIDLKKLEKYLSYYEENQFDKNTGLFFWQDDIMVGIDNNPTVFYREPRSSADIYLNSFLVCEYESMAELCARCNTDGSKFLKKAWILKQAINEQMWDEHDGIYYSQDIHFYRNKRMCNGLYFHEGLAPSWKTMPLKIRFWGCFLPMYAGICSEKQAKRLCKHLKDPAVVSRYGIRTLASNEKMYNLSKSSDPSNWLGAIWIVSNYLIFEGLLRYGQKTLAEKLRSATCELLEQNLKRYGNMFESYHPDTGEPNLYPGFLSWNLLSVRMLNAVI